MKKRDRVLCSNGIGGCGFRGEGRGGGVQAGKLGEMSLNGS